MNWLFGLNFANPAMVAGGAALVASPIIIHLINRLRFRRVRFAAMEFLLDSQQKNRRRVLIEQLLLLLLRILIVLAIVFLIARLILGANQMAILAGVKAHHVVLLDDSGSMRNGWDEEGNAPGEGGPVTAFDKAKRTIEALAAEGEKQKGTQQMTLLLLSRLDQPLFERADVDEAFLTDLKNKLQNLKPSHRTLPLADGLDTARELLTEEQTGIRHLHVMSDFREADWKDSLAVKEAIAALDADRVTVNLVKTVPDPGDVADVTRNLGIVGFTGDLHVAAAGVALPIEVAVRNFGQETAQNVTFTVFEDGQQLPGTRTIDEKIAPGATETLKFYVRFTRPGLHHLEVRLPADAYEPDNARHLAVDVADRYRVLIVEPEEGRLGSAYLQIGMSPEQTRFEPIVQSPEFLRVNDLDQFSMIFLLDVASLPRDATKPLEDYVRGGGGLGWFVGERVDAKFYSEELYAARKPGDSPKLFPVPLKPGRFELRRDIAAAPGDDVELTRHPIFVGLFETSGDRSPFAFLINLFEYMQVDREYTYRTSDGDPARDAQGNPIRWVTDDNVRTDGVRTIARLRNGDPLVFEHQYGEGRVLTFLTTAGPTWNNWAIAPAVITYVPIVLEMQRRLASSVHVPETRLVGEPLRIELDAADYTAEGRFQTPDEDLGVQKLLPKLVEKKVGETTAYLHLRVLGEKDRRDETDLPGLYKFSLPRQGGAEIDQRWFAYNVPPDEGELALAETDAIRERLGPDVAVTIQEPGEMEWLKGEEVGGDVKRGLLIALILFLLFEQLLAWRLSFHPETVPATR